VVEAGIVWRTSAHKGSPFLRRRAPAPNTADREAETTDNKEARHAQ